MHLIQRFSQNEEPLYEENSGSNALLCDIDAVTRSGARCFVLRERILSTVGTVLTAGRDTEIVGVMFINYRHHHAFSADEEEIVGTLASAAATAIAIQRLLNQRKEELILLAHQFRRPLLAARSWLDRAKRKHTEAPPTALNALEKSGALLDYAYTFSEGVLAAFEKVRSDGREKIDVATAVRDICENLKVDYGHKLFAISDLSEPLGTNRIVFLNVMHVLICNAFQYCDEHSTISISGNCECATAYEIRVTDFGVPIDLRDQERVFDQYYRGANAMQTYTLGVGLGLWFARRLMTSIGGRLSLVLMEEEPRRKEFVARFPRK
jgi:signal transduction histidine kinase